MAAKPCAPLRITPRRVFWLNPEPEQEWGETDSAMDRLSGLLPRRVRGSLAEAVGRRDRLIGLARKLDP